MKHSLAALLMAASITLTAGASPSQTMAADAPNDPESQTPWGLYLTAKEAGQMKAEQGNKVLFVDVREPVEIMFTGFTDVVDINVPFMLVNPSQWHPKKPVLLMERNPDFAAGIEQALIARGLGKDTPIILMCRSGSDRGAPSARALDGKGFKAVYVVVDGFEGVTSMADPNAPWRNVNGWKNSGWPWGYNLIREKIYTRSWQD
ncbi:MAG TPA: rhodanese-like domain-containing protein [Rhodospirillales bacterium]|nr:rhodanese-like domain-containing protein [Rhodospirillales bacterium]